jgi:hypothetical protein
MEIATEVTIAASSATIWRILEDVERYPQWNPYIRELHGKLAPGEPIRFRFALAWKIALPAKARVLAVAVERELNWAGHLLSERLFRAEHYHRLETVSDRSVRFHHGEHFSGVLAVLLWPFLRVWGPGRYRATNLALKQRAEAPIQPR